MNWNQPASEACALRKARVDEMLQLPPAAFADTMMLGMLEDVSDSIDSYRAEPNYWSLFALLHPAFEEQILRDLGWELMVNGYVN